MHIIRNSQLEVLENDFRIRRRSYIWSTIKTEYADLCGDVSNQEGIRLVGEAIEDGKALGIVADSDVVRFAVLALLPEKTLCDPIMSSVLIRVLNNDEWEPAKRLDFLHKHVVNRFRSAGDPETNHVTS